MQFANSRVIETGCAFLQAENFNTPHLNGTSNWASWEGVQEEN
jgi:hypothetical protein